MFIVLAQTQWTHVQMLNPREQRGLTLCNLASRLQKHKAKLNPHMAACDLIGYFISPVLYEIHVSIL
jgi:hypothetical protein